MQQHTENTKSEFVRARMSPDVKQAAEEVFNKLG